MAFKLPSEPPNNTGAATVDRFVYQARIAFRFCVGCSTGDIKAVYVEHFEDIVVEYADDRWAFLQIKSRESHLLPWTFADAAKGIKSLFRSFEDTETANADYCLYLEGGLKRGDMLENLMVNSKRVTAELKQAVCDLLKIDSARCESFLKKLAVYPNQPAKSSIREENVSLLGTIAPSTSYSQLERVEESLTHRIHESMGATRLKRRLFNHVCSIKPLNLGAEIVKRKLFTKASLEPLLGNVVVGAYPLLTRILDNSTTPPSNLERKMLTGRAKSSIVEKAKNLRANSSIQLMRLQASGLYDLTEKIEDMNLRHEQWAETIVAARETDAEPANKIWEVMTDKLMNSKDLRENLDPHNLLRDPMLLLGNLCDISDQCRFGWGGDDA